MIVLVTGCRSGFGLGVAVEAARRGHTVYAGLRDLSTDAELRAAAGSLDVRPIQLDVVDAVQRQAAVDQIVATHGRIDALVNNAGVALGGPLETIDEDELRNVLEINVIAPWALCCAVLPTMRAQRSGVIVNVGSVSGLVAMPGLGAYATSKFALEGMTEALWHEARAFGVHVELVEPGPFKTDIWGRNRSLSRRALDPDSPYAPFVVKLEQMVHGIAQDRAEDPAIVNRAIVDLIERPDGRLRHVLGRAAWIRIGARNWLPEAVYGAIVGRVLSR